MQDNSKYPVIGEININGLQITHGGGNHSLLIWL